MTRPAITTILATPDVERLRAFYAGLLGADLVDRVPEQGEVFYLGLRVRDSVLGIVRNADVQTGKPVRILLSVDVDDVDVLLPRVTELGGEVQGEPNDMPWGQRVAHVLDPDGNGLNLTQEIAEHR